MDINIKDLKFSDRIAGEGGAGIIRLAKWNDKTVAVKGFKKKGSFANEAAIMEQLSGHPNILKLLAINRANSLLVLEYMPGGTMIEYLQTATRSWQHIMSLVRQIVGAMQYMHENRIVHLDLKFENVLLSRDLSRIKLCDFGTALVLPSTVNHMEKNDAQSVMGTVYLMAPEVAAGWFGTYESDVWSFGCMLFELITGTHPFASMEASRVFNMLGSDEPLKLPPFSNVAGAPPLVLELAKNCFVKDISARPAFAAIGRFIDSGEWSVRSSDPHTITSNYGGRRRSISRNTRRKYSSSTSRRR